MKLNKVLCLIMMLAVVFSLASCALLEKLPFFPKKEEVKYKVEFDSADGSAVEAQCVAENGLVVAPEDPTKEGYKFLGWYNGDEAWNFETPVTSDLVLVARWEKLPAPCTHVDKNDDNKCDKCGESFSDGSDKPAPTVYAITYYDGETVLELAPASYSSASTGLTLPAPEKAHYVFDGWYADADLTEKVESINVNAGKDLVFYAKFTPVSYSITYVLNDGVNAEGNPAEYTVEDLPIDIADPSRADYNFIGWFVDEALSAPLTEITADNAGDITIYAKWELIPPSIHNVNYYVNDVLVYTAIFDEKFGLESLFDAAKPGYEFSGWKTADGTSYESVPAGTATDLDLYATLVGLTYSITYYNNDGMLIELEPVSYQTSADGTALPALPELVGVAPAGWFDADGNKFDSVPADYYGDLVLYAQYTSLVYTITYELDGGENSELNVDSYVYGEIPSLHDPLARDGYLFAGWYADEDLTVLVESLDAFLNQDITLYAKWVDDGVDNVTPGAPM